MSGGTGWVNLFIQNKYSQASILLEFAGGRVIILYLQSLLKTRQVVVVKNNLYLSCVKF